MITLVGFERDTKPCSFCKDKRHTTFTCRFLFIEAHFIMYIHCVFYYQDVLIIKTNNFKNAYYFK